MKWISDKDTCYGWQPEKLYIEQRVYYHLDEEGNRIYDVEQMREEFEQSMKVLPNVAESIYDDE